MIFGVIGGIKIGRGNRSTRRKPTPAPLCPPQNPTWQTRSRTPDRSGGKPATNRLSYGAAFFSPISSPLTTRRVTVEAFDPASTRVIDEGDCGAIGGMKFGRGNRSTRRKPTPAPFCPPQIPRDQTRARTRSAAVGSQQLTAWAMALPRQMIIIIYYEQNWWFRLNREPLEHQARLVS
jgi:hypothetical protein